MLLWKRYVKETSQPRYRAESGAASPRRAGTGAAHPPPNQIVVDQRREISAHRNAQVRGTNPDRNKRLALKRKTFRHFGLVVLHVLHRIWYRSTGFCQRKERGGLLFLPVLCKRRGKPQKRPKPHFRLQQGSPGSIVGAFDGVPRYLTLTDFAASPALKIKIGGKYYHPFPLGSI